MAGLITEESTEGLVRYRAAITAELDRRTRLENAADQMRELSTAYLAAAGVAEGDEWRAPLGAHDAYPSGWVVAHDGRTWESTVDGNVWEPGVSGWREVAAEGVVQEWVRPSGAHDAYQAGDTVTFEGGVWRSVIDANTWSPAEYPAGWARVGGEAS